MAINRIRVSPAEAERIIAKHTAPDPFVTLAYKAVDDETVVFRVHRQDEGSFDPFAAGNGVTVLRCLRPQWWPSAPGKLYLRGADCGGDNDPMVATRADFFNLILPAVREFNEQWRPGCQHTDATDGDKAA